MIIKTLPHRDYFLDEKNKASTLACPEQLTSDENESRLFGRFDDTHSDRGLFVIDRLRQFGRFTPRQQILVGFVNKIVVAIQILELRGDFDGLREKEGRVDVTGLISELHLDAV